MADDEEEAELYGVGAGNEGKHTDMSMEGNDNSLDDGHGEKDEDEAGDENGDDDGDDGYEHSARVEVFALCRLAQFVVWMQS